MTEFRTTDLIWDKANRKFYENIEANESDQNGRRLTVQVLNQSVIEDLSNATLSLYWKSLNGNKGLDAFAAIDASKGLFEISYTTGMLSNSGKLKAHLVLVDTEGRIISNEFTITVSKGIDDSAIESSDSFTALTTALVTVNEYDKKIEDFKTETNAQLAQKAKQTQVDTLETRVADVIQSADLDPNKDQEVVDARLGELTLATKLIAVDNKLSKIDSRFENKLINGNFENDSTGWIAGTGVTYGSIEKALVGGKSAKIVQNSSFSLARQDVSANVGDKLYVRASVLIDSYVSGVLVLRCVDFGFANTNATFIGFDTTALGQWQTRSMIRTCANNGSNIQVGSTTNATYTAYTDALMTINLTEIFGLGNEPTKEEMDELISFFPEEWFDGKVKPDKTQTMLIDMLLKDIKNKDEHTNSENGKYTYVSTYGTSGEAIQSAFDNANGSVVIFDSGVTYETAVSLNVNPQLVRGIIGNNAIIKVTQDVPTLKITGNFPPTLSADPDRFDDSDYGEMNMFIDNLRITCGKTLAQESTFIGTAIEMSQTFGISIRGCHFYKLKHGIRFNNKNRNFILTGNHIYYILENGITFSAGSDFHQVNFTANHISYFRKGIYFEPTSYVFNLQVVGNDLESSTFPVGAESIIHCEGILLEVEIVGNTIQDHEILTLPQMYFANETRQLHISANTFGNSSNGIIKCVGGGQIVIANNSANGGVGRFLEFALELNTMGVVVNGNSTRDLDFMKIHSVVPGSWIENSQVFGNVTHNAKNLPTVNFENTDLREFTFKGNSIMVHSNHGDLTKPIVSLKNTPVRTSRFSGNTLRGTNKAKHAMDIQPTSTYRTIISDNIAYQVTDVNYILPVASANNVIVKDNI